MTQEEALKEGLLFIADCLEKGEWYSPSCDAFLTGDALDSAVGEFARRLGTDQSPNWILEAERRKKLRKGKGS